jgi:Zn-dependent M28 family amino/carboxypeptidase
MVLVLAAACSDESGTSGLPTTGNPAPSGSCDAACGVAIAAGVSRDRLVADVATLAQPRLPGSAGWKAAMDLCAQRFTDAGFNVERQGYGTGTNVIGTLASGSPGPRLLVSAHYDGVANCQAADDNASGVAGVLEAARVLGAARLAGTLVVACWDEEELGMVGSGAYADRAKSMGEVIDAAFSLDMIGYRSTLAGSQNLPAGFDSLFPAQAAQIAAGSYTGDFVGVILDSGAHPAGQTFAAQAAAAGVPELSIEIPNAILGSADMAFFRRSDHASFWRAGMPALMVTDTAELRNPHYHCINAPDVPADLDADFVAAVVRAQVGTIAVTLGVR